MHRDAGVIGRLLAHGVVAQPLPRIWEDRAHDFRYDEVLDQADYHRHSRYVEHQARKKGYEGPIWVVRCRPGRRSTVANGAFRASASRSWPAWVT